MENLPQYKDVLHYMCSYLSIFDIIRLSGTNRGYSKVLGQDYFKMLCEKSNINMNLNSQLHLNNWKFLYVDQVVDKFYNIIFDDKYWLKFRKVDDSLQVIIGYFSIVTGFFKNITNTIYKKKDYEKKFHYETKNDYLHVMAEDIMSSQAMKESFFEAGLSHFKVLRQNDVLFYNDQRHYGRSQKEVLSDRKQLSTMIEQAIYSVLKYGEVLFLVGRQLGHSTNGGPRLVDLDCGVELHFERNYDGRDFQWMPEYLYYISDRDDISYIPHPCFFPKRLQEWIDNETDDEWYFAAIGPIIHDRVNNFMRKHVSRSYLSKYKRADAELKEMDRIRQQQHLEWKLLMDNHIQIQQTDESEDDEPVEEPIEMEIEDDLFFDEDLQFVDDPDLCDEEDEDQPEDGN